MASRHNSHSNGASHSNTRHSRDQYSGSRNRSSASFSSKEYDHLKDRIQKMENTQYEILQLLKGARVPLTTPMSHLPQELPVNDNIPHQSMHVDPPPYQAEVPLQQGVKNDRNVFHDELRQLVREEFLLGGKNMILPCHNIRESSPLIEVILQDPIPSGFKMPTMDFYDGVSDPYEHIDHYRTIMHIQRASDALLCQVFPATLKGQARTWFYSLPRGSIHTFTELARKFVEQFIANRRIVKDSSHLSGIRQNEGESLKEYFQRFSFEARQIPGVYSELLRGVFLGGLRPGPFYSSLMRDTVHSYADLIYRVEAQISADEAINAHRKQFEQSENKRKNISGDTHQLYKK